MTMQLNPYLTFSGNAQEAASFYQSVFGGEVQVMTFRAAGMDQDGVMHAALRSHWEKLSNGGQVMAPLEKQMWGDVYGQAVDRYGITWHVNITTAR